MWKTGSSLKRRLNMLLVVCLIPLTIMIFYLIILVDRFSERYDVVVEKITMANAYNLTLKEDIDYIMYVVVVNSERAQEIVDTTRPHTIIAKARQVFGNLYEKADGDYARNQLDGILRCLNTLEDRIGEIEEDALVSGTYDENMVRLDLNVRILTELIQEQIQEYIYYEATNLEALRAGIRKEVESTIRMSGGILIVILLGALVISKKITIGITEPIRKLCEVTRIAGRGDFAVRAQEESSDELAVLNTSFNQMVENWLKISA